MSGSQFAPEPLCVIDAGDAPVIFIDGMAVYSEISGTVRTVFYANQPVIDAGAEGVEPCKFAKVVVLKLIYTAETQSVMRRQMAEHLGPTVSPVNLLRGMHS